MINNILFTILHTSFGYFLVFLQIIIFLVFLIDKISAIMNLRRIDERLLFLGCIFAPLGATIGIFLLKHKVRKKKFLRVAIILVLLSTMSFMIFTNLIIGSY